MASRTINIFLKSCARSLTLVFLLVICNSCYRQYFATVSVAGTGTDGKTKATVIHQMINVNKYVVVHYGSKVVHLANVFVDSTHQTINGFAENLNEEHLEVRNEANNSMRLRFGKKNAVLNETNIYISRFSISQTDEHVMIIPYSAIKRIDIHQRHVVKNVGSDILSTLVGAPAIGVVVLAVACNCPHVKVIGKDSVSFKGTLFPGAIGKTLQRTDQLILKDVPLAAEGKINIQIANELPEIEFIDQVELHELIEMPYKTLALKPKGQLISLDVTDSIHNAKTQNERDITKIVNKKDSLSYDYSDAGKDEELNKVYLKFKNRGFMKQPLLVLNAKQDKWIESIAEYGFSQLGNKFDEWTQRLNKVDPDKFSARATAKGLSLGIYLKVNGQWEYVGTIENIGTPDYRMKALQLDVSKINGEFIELKLEAAHAFWDLDFAGLSDKWTEDIVTRQLKTIVAKNNKGMDVLQTVSAADKNYEELPEKGNYIDLTFEAPSDPNAYLILKGSGYYNHVRHYTHKPNYRLLNYMRSHPLSYHQASRLFYFQKNATVKK